MSCEMRPVRRLDDEVAKKIAAGEVIDRPAAIVRELIDNSLDAGADEIVVELESGGIELVRVADDGFGMTREDLQLCVGTHTTSKIATEKDLLSLQTLGFRGEALSSVAAVADLKITSHRKDETTAFVLEKKGDSFATSPASLDKGTVVVVRSLFKNFPARRVFLKRAASEMAICKQIFVEKAMAHPGKAFRMIADGKRRMDLEKAADFRTRFIDAMGLRGDESEFSEIGENYEQFSFRVVISSPQVYRDSRKNIFIFVNGRRIWEYSLVQAVEYGGLGRFPNGTFPVAALFLQIDPACVDFNIHPAKKEARFRDIASLHHAISSCVRRFFSETQTVSLVESATFKYPSLSGGDFDSAVAEGGSAFSRGNGNGQKSFSHFSPGAENVRAAEFFAQKDAIAAAENARQNVSPGRGFRYFGTALGVFLVVEKDETLFLIDKHAAHERILFNNFIGCTSRQKLIFPYVVESQSQSDDDYIESLRPELEARGFEFENCGEGRFEFSTVPSAWIGGEGDLAADLLEKRIAPKDLAYSLAAESACRGAVKDGDPVDDASAKSLVEQTFALGEKTCPHGRPLWIELPKSRLFGWIRRTK